MSLRVERVEFNSWGCFAEHTIEFAAENGKVDLIYGENATGKSTTGRGLRSLLYGIDGRTDDDHTFPYSELRIGARLQIDGKPVELSRIKKPSGPLIGADGLPLAEDPIAVGLGGLSEEVYRGLFHVNEETLDRGAEELLRGGGEVGESLFAAAAGIRALHETLTGLDAEAEANYNPPRGRKGQLEAALRDLRECEKTLRTATLKPRRHASLLAALRADERSSKAITAEIRELEARMRATERRRMIAPILATHARLSEELEPIADTPALAKGAAAERSATQARLSARSTQLERARQDLEELEDLIDSTEVDQDLLQSAEVIDVAKEEISAVVKAAKDRRKLEGQLHQAQASLRSAAETIGLPADRLSSARRSPAAGRALDAEIGRHDEIATRLEDAKSRLVKANRERDGAAKRLAGHPEAPELGSLEAALGAALGAGTLAEQAGALEAEHKAKAAAAKRSFEELHPRPAKLGELGELNLPAGECCERAAATAAELDDLCRTLDSEEAALAERRAELAEEGDRLAAEGDPLSQEDLAEARARREQAWGPIRSGAESGQKLDAVVAEGFEEAVSAADQLADRRTDAAARLERAAAHAAASKRLESEAAERESRRRELAGREGEAASAWDELWATSGLEALAPESAPAWLASREKVLALDADAQNAGGQAAALREREASYAQSLRDELAALGTSSKESLTLAGLCSRAQKLVEGERESNSRRVALETTLRGAEQALEDAEEGQSMAEAALVAWRESWPEHLKDSGLPSDTSPADAQEIVRAIQEAAVHIEQIESLERRIAGIDADREDFGKRVDALCEQLAPELGELEAERAAAALHGRLGEHEKKAERLAARLEQRDGARTALARAVDEIAAAKAALEVLVSAAGAKDEKQLPEIEQRSERARSLREEIAALERQAVEAGEGPFEELLADAENFDRDVAAAELERLGEEIEESRGRRDQIREEIVKQRTELAEIEVDTTAVRAREDVELALSRVEAASLAHARARIAATVVRRAIERYRREHENPMLERTKQLFVRFTQKTFSALYVDVESGGKAVLVGRQYDGALKQVEEMSQGTREQLFLALRIAAIERYVETSGPVPVTFDDVFSESDEPRSQRIFEALGELSQQTQVTVLTHHRHLIEVSRRALDDGLVVQELPVVAPALRVAEAA